jgi:WD40 repeat protein
VWDVAGGRLLCAPDDAGDAPAVTSWSRDGTRLAVATAGANGQISLYDAATGTRTAVLDMAERGGALGSEDSSPVFSPDGRRVACLLRARTSPVVKVWDTDTGKELLALPPPPTRLGWPADAPLAFSTDGHRLIFVASVTTVDRPAGPGSPLSRTRAALTVLTWDATPRAGGISP